MRTQILDNNSIDYKGYTSSSLDIAIRYGHKHKNILASFRNMLSNLTLDAHNKLNFQESKYKDKRGKYNILILMDDYTANFFISYTNTGIKKQKISTNLLYVISDGIYKKIGITTEDKKDTRLKQLQTGNPRKLSYELTLQIDNARSIEAKLHKYFKEKNTFSEWFIVSLEEIISQINKIVGEKLEIINPPQYEPIYPINDTFDAWIQRYIHFIHS